MTGIYGTKEGLAAAITIIPTDGIEVKAVTFNGVAVDVPLQGYIHMKQARDSVRTASRQQVYDAIDSEREYQENKWPQAGHFHSWEEWITYIEDYLAEAKHMLSRNDSRDINKEIADIFRKVTTMGVCAQEQNGCFARVQR